MIRQNITKEQMDKTFAALDKVIGGDTLNDSTSKEEVGRLIANRKYVLAHIVERYSSWHDSLDCLPEFIQVGAYEPIFIKFTRV